MLCIGLENASHGLFLITDENPKEQLEWAKKLQNYFTEQLVTFKDLAMEGNANKFFNISSIKRWIGDNLNRKIFVICNIQLIIDEDNHINTSHRLNYMRDELNQLNIIIVLCMSPYLANLLAKYAPDLYSFFSLKVNFISKKELLVL